MPRLIQVAALALGLALLFGFAGQAGAQTVTPVASQLLPCRAGGGSMGQCGGLCAVGYQCVYVPANGDCSCQVNELVCRSGTNTTNGFCPFKPDQVGGNCSQRGLIYRCE